MRETGMTMLRTAIAAGAVVLAGCAGAPGYRAPAAPLPTSFREGVTPVDTAVPAAAPAAPAAVPATAPAVGQVSFDDSTGPAAFWRQLGDTTLDRLVSQVLQANLDLRAAEARVRGARAVRTQAAFDLAPTVTFAGGYTRQRLSSATFPIGAGAFPDQNIWDGGFDASWEIDLFGRVRRSVQAQGAFVAVEEANRRDLDVTLTAEVARSYFELRGAQEALTVARQNAANEQKTFDITQQRLDAGKGTAFDTERARAQLNITLASIPTLEANVAAAQYRIGVLTGRSPEAAADGLGAGALPALPDVEMPANARQLITRRPDVVAAERRAAAQGALVGVAKADYLPRISVAGAAGYTAGTLHGLGDPGTFRYAVGPVLTWPALNLGRVKARVNQAQAAADAARADYDQTVLSATEEAENALARYRAARGSVARIAEAAAASAHAAELARLRYDEGVADFLQVLDAERTQLDAESRLAQSRTDVAVAYAALFKALGGM